MARIPPLEYADADPDQRAAQSKIVREQGRMTNMKRTLLRSLPALRALMEWYPLRDAVEPFLGERLTTIFSHAISEGTDCLVCSTYFRRIISQWDEDPDTFELSDEEEDVVEFARCLAREGAFVPDDLYRRLASRFTDDQIVALTAFGAMMVATNVFNNALGVDLDDYLQPYRAAEDSA